MLSYDLSKKLESINVSVEDFRLGRANANQIKDLDSVYFALFHKHITGCKNCLYDAIFQIRKHFKLMENTFKLKAGAYLIDPHNQSMDCTHRTLTDEKAIHHLRRSKDFIKFFAVVPDDWEGLVDGKVKQPEKDYTVKELKQELIKIGYIEKDFIGKNKAELQKMLDEG